MIKKRSEKIKIVIVCLMIVFSISGCQNLKQQNSQMEEDVNVLSTNDLKNSENKDFLSVSIKNNKEAEFRIKSNAFLTNHYAGKDAKESNIVYSWKVLCGPFCMDATIGYQEGVEEYSTKDIQCNLSYVETFEDGGYSTWWIKNLDYTLTDDTLIVTVILPTEDELRNLDNIDTASLFSYGFDAVEQYEYAENEQGMELFCYTLKPDEIEVDSLEAATSTENKEDVFPESVYEAGLQKGKMDSVWMSPSTENYIIFDKSKLDPNGMTGLDQKIVLVFDQIGNLKEGYVREGYITGMEAGKDGPVPVMADQESMQLFLDNKLAEGYLVEGSEKKLNPGEACTSENYIYYRISDATIENAHKDSVTQQYLTDIEWIKASPWNAISRMPEILYTTDQVGLLYESDMVLDTNVPMVDNYCVTDDFQYLCYVEMITDDYYISETPDECNVYFFDEAGNCVLLYRVMNITDAATHKSALASGYEVVGDSKTLVTMKWENSVAETKKDVLLNFKNTLITGEYSSYEQSITQNGVAFFLSKPWLSQ